MGLLKARTRTWAKPNLTEEGFFRPAPRGCRGEDLSKALVSRKALSEIAPETPRPIEMLEHVRVVGDDRLTADDHALHELLVDHAYRVTGQKMDRLEFSMPMSSAMTFLGEHARRSGIKASLARLRSTTVTIGTADGRLYEEVQLLVPWTERDRDVSDDIHFIIPRPIAALMASQPRYAYLELEPLSRMRSRYGVRLYRHLAAAMRDRVYDPSSSNLHEFVVPVGQLAEWLGYRPGEGKALHVGQFRDRAVEPAIEDLFWVRSFCIHEAVPQHAAKRGAPIESWRFVLRKAPTDRHLVRPLGIDAKHLRFVGGVDDPAYRVDQFLWLRAAAFAYRHTISASASDLFEGWLVGLKEALMMSKDETAMPVSDGHYTQRLRGERLLLEIEARGTQATAWAWAMEEIAAPDLIALSGKEGFALARDGRKARFERYHATAKGKAAVEAKAKERKEARAAKKASIREAAASASREADVAATSSDGIILDLTGDADDVEAIVAELRGRSWSGTREIGVTVRWVDEKAADGFGVWCLDPGIAMSQADVRRLAADSQVAKLRLAEHLRDVQPSPRELVPPSLRWAMSDEVKAEGTRFNRNTDLVRGAALYRLADQLGELYPLIARLDDCLGGTIRRCLRTAAEVRVPAGGPYPWTWITIPVANGQPQKVPHQVDWAMSTLAKFPHEELPTPLRSVGDRSFSKPKGVSVGTFSAFPAADLHLVDRIVAKATRDGVNPDQALRDWTENAAAADCPF
jgi:hypothetical protein